MSLGDRFNQVVTLSAEISGYDIDVVALFCELRRESIIRKLNGSWHSRMSARKVARCIVDIMRITEWVNLETNMEDVYDITEAKIKHDMEVTRIRSERLDKICRPPKL